jgi:2-polyprenyl-3-methyl-5-hydroxy-6-metoxy-1,4-benzoquinol methylase
MAYSTETTIPPDAGYEEKPVNYFSGARKSFVDELPTSSTARMLEIGCGNGDTAAYAKTTGKCVSSCGVELCEEPAEEARTKMDVVIVGDVETLELPFERESFDVLIMSEVVEHLRDPWAALRKLHPFLKPGAIVLAGSPNVAHHSVLWMQIRGQWTHAPSGIMDRTHLRWFTPASYRQLFEDCGFTVDFSGTANPLRWKARWFNRLTFTKWEHMLHTQIFLKGRRKP